MADFEGFDSLEFKWKWLAPLIPFLIFVAVMLFRKRNMDKSRFNGQYSGLVIAKERAPKGVLRLSVRLASGEMVTKSLPKLGQHVDLILVGDSVWKSPNSFDLNLYKKVNDSFELVITLGIGHLYY